MLRAVSIVLAVAILLCGEWSNGLPHREASAATEHDGYAGAITMTDWRFPDGTGLGGAPVATGVDNELNGALIAGLWRRDPTGALIPELATDTPTLANGGITTAGGSTVVTVHRRPDQHWSDGSPITNNDYILSVLLAGAPEATTPTSLGQIATVAFTGTDMIVTYKGNYTPSIPASVPNPLPLEYMEYKYGAYLPTALTTAYSANTAATLVNAPAYARSPLQRLAKAWLADAYAAPNDLFSGPYKLAEWSQGQQITLTPNIYYTALAPDPQHPRPAAIRFVTLSNDESSLRNKLTSGSSATSIDKAEGFQITDAPSLQQAQYQVVAQPSLRCTYLAINQANRALRDVRVRLALLYAIDKQAYLRAEFPAEPDTIRLALNQISPLPLLSAWSNNTGFAQNPYNPIKAKTLLVAAGYPNGIGADGKRLQFTMVSLPTDLQQQSAVLLKYFWAQIGVSVKNLYTTESGPNGLFSSYADGGILARRLFDIAQIDTVLPDDPTKDQGYFDSSQIPDANNVTGVNFSGIHDQQLLAYLQAADQAQSETEQRAIYSNLQIYFVRQAYWIMLFNMPNMVATKDTIGNFQPSIFGNAWNAWQWYDKKLP